MEHVNKLREIQPSEDPPIYRECLEKLKTYKDEKEAAAAKGRVLPILKPVDTSCFEAVRTQAENIMPLTEDHPRIKFHVDATENK